MMDTKRFNAEHAAKSRAVCERIEREDAERRGKLADLVDAQLKGELGRAKAEADGWRRVAERRLGHIGECEKALAKRNALIVELEMRVKELEGELRNADQLGEREFPAAKVLDADGMEIKVGDSMYVANYGDGPYIVCDIDENIDRIELFWHENRNEKLFIAANRLTHTRPDSWERLEKDALKGVCEYAEAERKPGTIDAHTCCGCRFDEDGDGPTCEKQMALDIIRRAKALAGVEVE